MIIKPLSLKFLGYNINKNKSDSLIKKEVVQKSESDKLITGLKAINKISGLGVNCDFEFFENQPVKMAQKYESLHNPICFVAKAFSNLNITLCNSNDEIINNHYLLNSIQNPNNLQSQSNFLFEWAYNILCSGHLIMTYERNKLNQYKFKLISPDDLVIRSQSKNNIDFDDLLFYQKTKINEYQNRIDPINLNFISFSNNPHYDLLSNNVLFIKPTYSHLLTEIKNIELSKLAKQRKIKISGAIVGSPKPLDKDSMPNLNNVMHKHTGHLTHKMYLENILRRLSLIGNDFIQISTTPIEFVTPSKDILGLDFSKEVLPERNKIYDFVGIPKDLRSFDNKGSTYENQNRAEIRFYQNTIQSLSNIFIEGLNNIIKDDNLKFKGDYTHLPIFSTVEKDKQKCIDDKMKIWLELLKNGVIDNNKFKKEFGL